MIRLRTIAVAGAFAVLAGTALAGAPHSASASQPGAANATEFSAAKRYYHRRYVRHPAPRYSSYFRGPDPALGPDGLPYRVPPHLRGQCYIDEGYGRFSACPNR